MRKFGRKDALEDARRVMTLVRGAPMGGATGSLPIAPVAQGDLLTANATPEWIILSHSGAAGYALTTDASDVMWDQTPAWTGLHSFGAGWVLTGGTGDLDGNDLIIDTDGDSYLHEVSDDVVNVVLAGASGEFGINIAGVTDFTFTSNSFNVILGSWITMADNTWIGLGSIGGRIDFDSASDPDRLEIKSADLYIATTSHGLMHIDGVADGQFLRANGIRYVPDTLDVNDLTDLAYATPALTLGTSNGLGSADSVIRSDATVAVFDTTVPTTIQPDDAAATGSAGVAARRDHTHGIVAAIAVDISTANSEGTSTSFARADHVHNHPSGLGANLHHNQSHVLATTAGLGGDHTTSGLTAGQVLRATGATTAAFESLVASDLPAHTHSGASEGGSLTVGTTDTDAADTRVFFAGTGGVLQVDAGFSYDATNDLVVMADGGGIGNSNTTARLEFNSSGATDYALVRDCNVGVGTATPDYRLQVLSDAADSFAIQAAYGVAVNEFVGYSFGNDTYTKQALVFERTTTYARGKMHVLINNTADSSTPTLADSVLTIDADGDVGIDVTSPSGQLHVDQSSPTGGQPALFLDQGDTSEQCIQYSSDATDQDINLWTVNVTGTPTLMWDESEDSLIYSVDTPAGSQAATTDLLVLKNTSAGTAAADFGTGVLFQLEDAVPATVDAGRLAMVWESAAAAENAEFQLLLSYNGTLYEAGVIVGPAASGYNGNQRGDGSVDWQNMRSATGQVAAGNYCAISGGAYNTAGTSGTDHYASVGGGYVNAATGDSSTIAGGNSGTASGDYSAIGGGQSNSVSGSHSVVPGGYNNSVSNDNAWGGGASASVTHSGCFVWSSAAATASWATNSFTVRCHGGARFYSAAGTSTGVELAASGTSWASISCTREFKENLEPVEGILDKIALMPIYTYSLKGQDPTIRHISPIAPDFNDILGLGVRQDGINMLHLGSTALAGVQALIVENEILKARVTRLESLLM